MFFVVNLLDMLIVFLATGVNLTYCESRSFMVKVYSTSAEYTQKPHSGAPASLQSLVKNRLIKLQLAGAGSSLKGFLMLLCRTVLSKIIIISSGTISVVNTGVYGPLKIKNSS